VLNLSPSEAANLPPDKPINAAAYEKAIALNPALIEPRIYQANQFTDTGRVEQAVPLLRSVLRDSPNSAEAHWELEYAYRFGGMLKESAAEGEEARQYSPEVKINSSALNTYLYLWKYEKFLQSLPANDSVYILFYRGFSEYYMNNREQQPKTSIALLKGTLSSSCGRGQGPQLFNPE